jgi:predicted esterase
MSLPRPRHLGRLLLAVLILAASASGQTSGAPSDPPADLRISKSLAKRLVESWLHGPEKRRESAWRSLLRTRPEDRNHVAAALAGHKYKPPKESAKRRKELVRQETVKLEESPLGEGRFLIHLPKKYSGKKPYPLVIRMHGSGSDGDSYAQVWSSIPSADEFIAVAPTIPSADRMGWNQKGTSELLDLAYQHMLSHYNIDTDRVYLEGYSAGGGGAFYYAQAWPHRIAAIFARSRLWCKFHQDWEASMAVMEHVPGFYVVGLADQEDRIEGFRKAEAFFKKHRYPAEFRFVENRGHEYMNEHDREGYPFLRKQKRGPPPKRFETVFFGYSNQSEKERARFETQHWLTATKYDFRGTPVKVQVEGNTIRIDGKGLDAGVIRLNDQLVDLDQDVVVMLNEKEVFRGKVERSIRYLFEGYERRRDRGRLFWNQVVFPKAAGDAAKRDGAPSR